MDKKSKFELEIVTSSITIRVKHGKSQAYIAMILNVSEGYIGQVESPNFPSMYTHDQLNAIAIDLGISPQEFYPNHAIKQELPKKDLFAKLAKHKLVESGIAKLIKKGYFKNERYVKDIITTLGSLAEFKDLILINKDITDVLRPLTKGEILESKTIGGKNVYWKG
ncbi:hypothetical protein SAMN05216436_11435 [bacterium A37T11]|nr:hypothetical protein SAMN05216436_11435 [bacterium A37T11]